jgi:hypothetical protein
VARPFRFRSGHAHRVAGSSHVEHWLFGIRKTIRPRRRVRSNLMDLERSPRRHHRVPYVRHHYSVLRESHRPCSAHLRGALRRSGSRPSHGAGAQSRSWWPSRRPASPSTLENCIASTSIKVLPSYEEPTVDALAPDADEGRGWLRKATVSRLTGFDPWISEWGNPAGVMPSHPRLNT